MWSMTYIAPLALRRVIKSEAVNLPVTSQRRARNVCAYLMLPVPPWPVTHVTGLMRRVQLTYTN